MSDDHQDGGEAAPDYVPMPDAYKPERESPKIYDGNDKDDLREAAGDLDQLRDAAEAPIVERGYVTFGGEKDGQPRPDHETIYLPSGLPKI